MQKMAEILDSQTMRNEHTNINDKQMSKFLRNSMLSYLLVHDTNVTTVLQQAVKATRRILNLLSFNNVGAPPETK